MNKQENVGLTTDSGMSNNILITVFFWSYLTDADCVDVLLTDMINHHCL